MSLPVAPIPVQLQPTYGGPLDKRTVGNSDYQSALPYAAAGQLFYNTDTNDLLVHNGTAWISVSTGEVKLPGLGYNLYLSDFQYFWNSITHTTRAAAVAANDVFLTNQQSAGILTLNGRTLAILKGGGSVGMEVTSQKASSRLPFDVMNTVSIDGTSLLVKTDKSLEVQGRFKIGTSQTEVSTSTLVVKGDMSTFEKNVTITGTLTVGGGAVTSNALNATTMDVTETDEVGTTIGQVAQGTTVQQLIDTYQNVQKLLAAMLNIGPPPALSATGFSLTVSYSTVTPASLPLDLLVGTSIQDMTITITYNRGQWSGPVTSGDTLPYGRVASPNGISYTEPFTGAAVTVPVPDNTTQDTIRPFDMQSNTFLTTAFVVPYTSLQTYYLTNNLTVSILQGGIANNASGSYQTAAQPAATPTNVVKFRTYAPVRIELENASIIDNTAPANSGAGTGGNSGQASTDKLFSSTYQSEVIAANFDPAWKLIVPIRLPTRLYVYVEFNNSWVEQLIEDNAFTVTAQDRTINGFTVPCYNVQFTDPNRDPADIKIEFD